ncbi:lamin tail domain-containing protein [Flavobacterium sp. TSSA_36]|uniref:lamin tail domain-containing protein n=1 Tax=Flavobacterium sp. TSSA_36 TaxID=3447669 RepID=UPI003F2EEAA6
MKKYLYLSILSAFLFTGCSSEFTDQPFVEPEIPAGGFEDLLISEIATFINTDNTDKTRNNYVELYNGTGKAINLSDYAIGYQASSDESTLAEWTFTNTENYLQLSGNLDQGKAFVIGSNAANLTTVKSNITWGTSSTANADASKPLQLSGNSAIALLKKDAAGTHTLNGAKYKIIDVFGSPKVARIIAASNSSRNNFIWSIAGESGETRNNTFYRKKSIKKPNADWALSKGTTIVNSEWIVSAPRSWDYSNVGLFTVADDPTGPTVPTNPFQELLISELATAVNTDPNGGAKRNHYVELYNGTDNSIDLSNYAIGYQATTDEATLSEWSFTDSNNYLLLTGSLAKEKAYVIASNTADPSIVKSDKTWGTTSEANADASKPLQLSGNSAIALLKKDAAGTHTLNGEKYKIIDVFGSPQVPRLTATSTTARTKFYWSIAGESGETRNNTFWRKKTVTKPNTDWSVSKGTTALDSEWNISPDRAWDYSNIGSYSN